MNENEKTNLISIGIISDLKEDNEFKSFINKLIEKLQNNLQENFQEFNWQIRLIQRKDFIRESPVDPVQLLDFGSSLKLEYNLDFVLLITSLPLKARFNQFVNAVPSNILETAVISFARFLENNCINALNPAIALIKHNLGHLWGLEHNENSVMKSRNIWSEKSSTKWNNEEKKHIENYLKKIADPRLEELSGSKIGKFSFYCKFLKNEGLSILRDIIVFRSWLTIIYLSKFVAAIVISTIFLFLTAEFWEIGAAIKNSWIYSCIIFVLTGSTLSLYFGQSLNKIAQSDRLKEQAVRSKLVIFGTLLIGISALWLFLLIISTFIISIFPEKVLINWSGVSGKLPILHFALLISILGISISAFGGNLEEEDDLKAILFYTEET